MFQYQQVKAGDVLFDVGDPSERFYLLVKGHIKRTGIVDGKEVELAEMKEKGHFGEMELLQDQKMQTKVVAVTDCVFMVLSAENFQKFLSLSPEMKPHFLETSQTYRNSLKLDSIDIEVEQKEDIGDEQNDADD